MKKVFALMSIVAMFSMVACGPAKEGNDEADKKHIEDSIAAAAAETTAAEEVVATETTDSTATDSAATEAAPATEEAPAAHN
ncbi:MAG: hypothetical protein EP332_09470 [Bacteroidetes bacterium]|nr:MAG: hypothetical protein EP332_09470 [Bacteroidota bacterium]